MLATGYKKVTSLAGMQQCANIRIQPKLMALGWNILGLSAYISLKKPCRNYPSMGYQGTYEMKKMTKLLLIGIVALALGGCGTLPVATYTTSSGCGIAQWDLQWVQSKVESMTWSGACKSGLAHGNGILLVKLIDGKRIHYAGNMDMGDVHGEGTLTFADGWKIEGNILWLKLVGGKVYNSTGRLLFDGLMAHNVEHNGQLINLNDQRYHSGKLYFPDGSYIDDGKYTGSAGLYVGMGSIDPLTGKGIIYGTYMKDGKVVYRLVDGKLYQDESSYMKARYVYSQRQLASLEAVIAVQRADEEERRAREIQEALNMLENAVVAAAEGTNATERRQLALKALASGESGVSGGAAAAKSNSKTIAPKKYRYNSVCERNYEKIQNVIRENNISQAGATYDLFMKDMQWHYAKIFEPCKGSSTEAARAYKASMDEYNKIGQYCAGPHPKYECTQWGANGGISDNGGSPYNNIQYYNNFKAEVDKALSDPNYSADLGTLKGAGAVNTEDAACDANLKAIEDQYSTAQRGIPKDSIVARSEATMWMIVKSIAKIKEQCPQSERYKAETATLHSQYGEIKRVCDASASNPPCKPRLPGKEPTPATQVATATQPPLQKKPPVSCENQSGANWKKCMQEACARQEGTFSGNNCVSCYWAGGGWNRCPPGSGGVNSNQ